MFVIFGFAYIITAITYIVIRNVRKDCKYFKVIWLVDIAYFIGGLLYYVGRNLQLPLAQSILLGTVVVLYRFIPFFISKYYQSSLAKEHQTTEAKLQLVPEWILAAESLTLLVEFDALYIITTNSFSPFLCCTSSVMTGSWLLSALFVLTYMLILFYTIHNQYIKWNVNISCVAFNVAAIITGCLLYVLAWWQLNSTQIRLQVIGKTALLGIEIAMKLFVLIFIVLLLVYRCTTRETSYSLSLLNPEPDERELVDNNDYSR